MSLQGVSEDEDWAGSQQAGPGGYPLCRPFCFQGSPRCPRWTAGSKRCPQVCKDWTAIWLEDKSLILVIVAG